MSKNINVPNLRFKEFIGEWEEKKLQNIAELISGQHLTPSEYQTKSNNSPYFTGPSDYTNNFSNVTKWAIKEYKMALKNDILITVKGSGVGELFYLDLEKVFIGRQLMSIRAINVSSKLIYQFLLLRKNIFQSLSFGNMIPGISRQDILSQKFILPKREEQEKIAIFLSSVDEKIEKLTKKDELLQQYKKSIMQKIFSQEIRFTADNGNKFPEWEEKKLKNLCDVIKGEQLNKDNLTEVGDYPAINGGINPSGFTDKWNTFKNTITISEGGNSCGYVNFIKTNFWSGGHNYSLQNLKKNIENRYLFQYLKYNESQIMNLRVGSGLPNIQKNDIVKFKILLPCLEEQNKIANFLSSIDDKIEENQKLLEKTKEFKKSLLQQMFI